MPFTAKIDAICVVCKEQVSSGSITRPLTGPENKIEWAHFDCVVEDDGRIPLCKHWSKRGTCLYQEKCFFRHPDLSSELLVQPQRKRHVISFKSIKIPISSFHVIKL